MGRVEGKVVWITGGAAGIGAASAAMLGREGARVVLTDVDETGEQVAADIRRDGGEAEFQRQDVGAEESWDETGRAIVVRHGRLDVLVNNAGIGHGCAPDAQTLEDWRRLLRINLDGVFLGTRCALRLMARNEPRGGSIINLSSIEGIVGDPQLGAYNASKGGVRLYTKSVALWCGEQRNGIRVNSVHPGYVWTPMVESYLREQGDVAEGRRALDAMHPIGHVGEPDDIAWGILYLASDESRFVTGAELVIDGGYTAR